MPSLIKAQGVCGHTCIAIWWLSGEFTAFYFLINFSQSVSQSVSPDFSQSVSPDFSQSVSQSVSPDFRKAERQSVSKYEIFKFHSNLMECCRVDVKTFMSLAVPNQYC